MTIPRQDQKTYTEEEIEQILARRMAAMQLTQLTDRVTRNEVKTAEVFSEIRASLTSLNDSISSHSGQVYKLRDELRNEMEKDFVTQKVFDAEMKRLELLISSQWQRITVAVSAVVLTIQIGFKFIGG